MDETRRTEPTSSPFPPERGGPTPGLGPQVPAASASAAGLRDGSTGAASVDQARIIDAHGTPGRVPWRAVAAFLVIAFAGAWLVELPLWLSGTGIEGADPHLFANLTLGMMWTPTLGALVAVFLIQRPDHPIRMLGLSPRPVLRTLGYLALIIVVAVAIQLVGGWISGAVGLFPLAPGLGEGYLIDEWIAQGGDPGTPPAVAAIVTAVQLALVGTITAVVATFGEELGWRGFLTPALRPLGKWPMMLISAVIWGLWHAPLILLGYNFQDRTPLGLLYMVMFCFATGLGLAWLRIRSESVWPAVFGHGVLNATAVVGLIAWASSEVGTLNGVTVGQLAGVWALWLVVFGVLFALARSPKARPWRFGDGEHRCPTHHAPEDLDEDSRSAAALDVAAPVRPAPPLRGPA